MIRFRILRDDALGRLPLFWLNGALLASVTLGALALDAQRRAIAVSADLAFLAGWLGIAVFLAAGRTRRRASGFDLVLPLSAHGLWAAHLTAVLLAGTLLAVGPALVIMLHAPVRGAGRAVLLDLDPLALFARLLCGFALAALLLEVPGPRLARAPTTRGWAVWTASILLGVPALVILLGRLGEGWIAGAPLAAMLVGIAVYRALPGGFALVPRDVGTPRRRARAGQVGARASVRLTPVGRLFAHPFVVALRCTSIGAKEWLMVPSIAAIGILCGGGLGWLNLDADLMDNRFMSIAMVLYILLTGIPLRFARLNEIDALPIRRRLVLVAVVAPYLLVFLASYGIGALGAAHWMARAEMVSLHEYGHRVVIGVPVSRVRIAWNGKPPVMTAPWGESHALVGVPLVRGARAVAYSPYQAPRGGSPDYVAWQASRALECVYVTRVSWQAIRTRYLVERADGSIGVREGGLTYRRDHPGTQARGTGPALPIVLLVGVAPLFLPLAVLLRYLRTGVSPRRRLIAFYLMLTFPFALWCAPIVAVILRFAWSGIASGGYLAIAAAWAGESAVRTAALWVLTGLLLAASYLVAEAKFRRMEISGQPLRLTLLD